MAFQFNFNLGQATSAKNNGSSIPENVYRSRDPPLTTPHALKYREYLMRDLLVQLPEAISYTPLNLQTDPPITIPRRDLFDVRFQLISQAGLNPSNGSEESVPTLEYLESPSDLVPGTYEGGLKTWECSIDLATHLASTTPFGAWTKTHKVLEIGCGTAVPTMFLLFNLLNHRHASGCSSFPEVQFYLQDYNSFALQLVTAPNLFLVWYLSDASAHFRQCSEVSATFEPRDAAGIQDTDLGGSETKPLEVEVTSELIDAFLETLRTFNVSVRLFSGCWEALCSTPSSPLIDSSPYTIVLTSETMYNTDSLGSLIRILQISSSSGHKTVEMNDLNRATLCLVAGKIVYFGVGGGVSEFVRRVCEASVAATDGSVKHRVETVWEQRHGVARIILQIHWD